MTSWRWVGAGLVVFAAVMLGRVTAERLADRVRTLEYLRFFLKTLSDRIRFSLEPLPTVVADAAAEPLGRATAFASALARELSARPDVPFPTSWERCLTRCQDGLDVSEETVRLLRTLGRTMGTMSKEIELDHLQTAIEGIEAETARAREAHDRNARTYRGLGALAGLLLVLVLW